jgi:ferredoxin
MTRKLILCDCLGSQKLDADGIAKATGLDCSRVHTNLCGDQMALAGKAIKAGNAIIACQQERQTFETLADELDAPAPGFIDLRDRAGWSDDAASAMPKMAALTALALLPSSPVKTLDVVSEGTCLIIGAADAVIPAAEVLCDTLAVTVLLTDDDAEPSLDRRYDCVRGALKSAKGTMGRFTLAIDRLQQAVTGGRGPLGWSAARDGGQSVCDIIVDLSGATPLFPAPEKRDGYLRADPKSQPAVAAVLRDAAQMIGTFEKPLYVRLEESLCAHSRAEQPACSKCLNICPTGAITSAGDTVAIDPMICAGCGACAALCPSGAIAFEAPTVDSVFQRINTLARSYRKAGGVAPRLLVHDADHGVTMIALAARYGRGLPADVIPLGLEALAGFGHSEMLAAIGAGFADVSVLLGPKTERDAIISEAALACALAGNASGRDQVSLIEPADPDALSDLLYNVQVPAPLATPIMPIGSRRQVARLAAKALNPDATILPLPKGAPYGAVVVDKDACTLCQSCVSLCPSGALGDNPDKPQLRFQEDACLQCGLCANICPENAISLVPQLDLTDAAFTQSVVHEEDPFACVECGSLFGIKSTVEKIMEKLAGKHSMFATGPAARMIQMCDNCRINAQYHSQNNPFAAGERPRVRTSEDYLTKRKDH